MQCFLVGGAVRDQLLGLPVGERDWVVVGASVEEMLALGYRQVGRDFPVFLHPQTHEEYALARTERKTAAGHVGFLVHAAPDVSLEADLRRRDLTINAMAQTEDGQIIDPYNGRGDLQARLLRHVSPAFAEDPLRVLRVARFSAQLGNFDFRVAPQTLTLLHSMAQAGELSELSAERIWAELLKALSGAVPARFFESLQLVGALAPWFVELEGNDRAWAALRLSHAAALPPGEIVAAMLGALAPAQAQALADRLRAPREIAELGLLMARYGDSLMAWRSRSDVELLGLLEQCDALRRAPRFANLCRVLAVARAQELSAATSPADRTPPGLALLSLEMTPLALLPLGLLSDIVGELVQLPLTITGITGPQIAAAVRVQRIEGLARLRAARDAG